MHKAITMLAMAATAFALASGCATMEPDQPVVEPVSDVYAVKRWGSNEYTVFAPEGRAEVDVHRPADSQVRVHFNYNERHPFWGFDEIEVHDIETGEALDVDALVASNELRINVYEVRVSPRNRDAHWRIRVVAPRTIDDAS